MHSLRTRITLVTVFLIMIAVTVVTALSVLFIRGSKQKESDQLLLLLCETGERNLEFYFDSVQKSVAKVADFAENDLDGLDDDSLARHMERVGRYFEEMAYRTNVVRTYYYRIDPDISAKEKGFWFINTEGEGFEEHEVTDITQYDTEDTSQLVWFTVPKQKGTPVWLPPYITDNLDVRVISYNVPVYYKGTFVGVVGIEIDYSTMAEQVESIRLYENGYAFLSDEEANIFYHPRIDTARMSGAELPKAPEELIGEGTFIRYTYEGVEKQAAWLPLSNGMRLFVTVPVNETKGDWQKLVWTILIVSAIVLITLSLFTLYYTGRITRPLEELTRAAEQVDDGNYDFTLEYNGDDEVGRLTSTFRLLSNHMKDHIEDLNKRVYVDPLTSVKNKGAFSAAMEVLQKQLELDREETAYGIGVFDCNDLKTVNDRYGHEKGDIYLKTACRLICQVFQHSPVFRIGGDEFAVILQNQDYNNREELIRRFTESKDRINASSNEKWEQVHVAMGIAEYDRESDLNVIDTVRRADKIMYADKQELKQ